MKERFADSEQATPQEQTTLQLVGFNLGQELLGVDILSVQEIIRDATITPIPDSPDFLEGVINLRGNIIPVIDLRKRLKLSQPRPADTSLWIIILIVEGRITGFVVDRVTKVLNIPEQSIKPPPEIVLAGLKSRYIRGVCRMDRQLLILLDFTQILMADEIRKLKSMKRPQVPVPA
jgi:purine-binding chemotaxis protein CheW